MKTKTVYKIECEWDMGFPNRVYETEELALEVIKRADWSLVEYESYEEVLEECMVRIVEVQLEVGE